MVQIFCPLSRQPVSVRVARVRTLARSEPEFGSLMPMQKKASPRQMRGNVELLLRLGAVLDDQRRALAIGDPVRRHRRAGGQQLLEQHEARERAAPPPP